MNHTASTIQRVKKYRTMGLDKTDNNPGTKTPRMHDDDDDDIAIKDTNIAIIKSSSDTVIIFV
jgi:hypothetical protein